MNEHPAGQSQTEDNLALVPGRDPLYLFVCYLEWEHQESIHAFLELLAALDDPHDEVRLVAECLLGRPSPRRGKTRENLDGTYW
jgi:hypothetical protein